MPVLAYGKEDHKEKVAFKSLYWSSSKSVGCSSCKYRLILFVKENYSFQDYEFSFQITMLFLFLQWLKRRLLSLLLEYDLGQDKRLLDSADIVCSPLQLAVPKEKAG